MPFRSLRRFVARRLGIEALRTDNAVHAAALVALQTSVAQHAADAIGFRDQIAKLREESDAAALAQTVAWATMWNSADPSQSNTLVSVVLATRNRADLLLRAVQSVLQQGNVSVELIVVDDASTDHTATMLAAIKDPRLTVVTGSGSGAGAARNVGVRHATGEIVAFADDDNIMAPGWLAAAARYLLHNEGTAGVYGAQIREPEGGGDLDLLYRTPFSRDDLLAGPYIDLGAAAFRAGTAELHFDESLPALLDWDMFIRVTAEQRLDAIPVLSSFYTTSAPHRISHRPDQGEALLTVRARAAAERASPDLT